MTDFSKKTYVIAEIGTAHGGDFSKAAELMDAAVDAGADGVKFQWVYADEILHPKTGLVPLPGGNISLYERFRQLETGKDFFEKCRNYAREKKTGFICSPFGLRSLKELLEIAPDAIKIASPELNHIPLLKALAQERKKQESLGKAPVPLVISSGVSEKKDIEKALSILGTKNLTLLHCVTSYPAPEEDYNLRVLKTLKKEFNVDVGVSDHSLDASLVPCLAVSQGASMIEKHITLSKETSGLDDPVALTAEEFGFMCHFIHQCDAVLRHYGTEKGEKEIISQLEESHSQKKIERILGNGIKTLAPSEKQNYGRTNRSIHYMRDMKKGETITESDIAVLRTEKILTVGISPEYCDFVIGKKLKKDVNDADGVQFDEIE